MTTTEAALRDARQRLNEYEQMQDAQAQCVPCKLCSGKAIITDAGPGAGYYIRCENSGAFRAAAGCMVGDQRLGGWAYNVMDWWNRLHSQPPASSTAGEALIDRAVKEGLSIATLGTPDQVQLQVAYNVARAAFRLSPSSGEPASVAGEVLPSNLAEIIEAEMKAWKGANGGIYAIHACALGVSIALRSALSKPTPVEAGLGEAQFVATEPRTSEGDEDEDGNPVWCVEIQTIGGWSVVATVWGGRPGEASARGQAILAALSETPPSQEGEQ